jgi:hypothetical protein
MHNYTVTEGTCAYCGNLYQRKRIHKKFCSDRCRVYYGREGGPAMADTPADDAVDDVVDTSMTAAIKAAQQHTRVRVPETRTALAITVRRDNGGPPTWSVRVPANSVIAAANIWQDLHAHIDDLVTLANKLGAEAEMPRLTIRTGSRPARKPAKPRTGT